MSQSWKPSSSSLLAPKKIFPMGFRILSETFRVRTLRSVSAKHSRPWPTRAWKASWMRLNRLAFDLHPVKSFEEAFGWVAEHFKASVKSVKLMCGSNDLGSNSGLERYLFWRKKRSHPSSRRYRRLGWAVLLHNLKKHCLRAVKNQLLTETNLPGRFLCRQN